jgi:O-antigen/teichoic acid export membrane protein
MITVFLILQGYGIIALVNVGIAANIVTLLLNIKAAKQLVPALEFTPIPSKRGLQEVFGYGLYSFLSQIFGIAFSYSDRLLIGIFIGSASVGYLTVPQDLAFRALSLVVQGGSVLFPKFSTIEDPAERVRLYLSATWSMLFFSTIVFVPLTVFIADFIALWVSKEFAAQSSIVGQLIAFSSIIRGAFITYEALFKGINKPQYITLLAFVVGITSLGLNYVLIPRFGLAGAGYSYCITALWGVTTLLITWKYVLRCKSFKPLVRTVLMPVLLAMICIGLGFQLKLILPPTNWFLLVVEVLIIIVIAAFLLITFEKWLGKEKNSAEIFLNAIRRALILKLQKV